MELTTTPTVGSFVAKDYRTAAVFQRYGIDFCCKGGRTLDEVCEKKRLDPEKLQHELEMAMNAGGSAQSDFAAWPAAQLADHIENKHHRYIEQVTPSIQQFLDKLCKVHGDRHPELFGIRDEFNAASNELAMHMIKEEGVLFPYIRQLEQAKRNGDVAPAPGFGTVHNPIRMIMHEHDVEGDRFARISELSAAYNPPADACNTYRVAFAMLKEYEEDLHLHIHLENNILFPKAVELEEGLN